jgi:hypothetical protein
MAALVVLFDLKDDTAVDEYEEWARTTDVPTVKGLDSVDDFRVFRADGLLMSDAPSPYEYVEIIEVNDMEQFGAEMESEIVQEVAAQFQEFADDPTFILTEQFA